LPPIYTTAHSLSQKFFRDFRQAKLSISLSQFRVSVTSDSMERPLETADLRKKAVLSFLYCATSNIIV